jgi:hypothetical protein
MGDLGHGGHETPDLPLVPGVQDPGHPFWEKKGHHRLIESDWGSVDEHRAAHTRTRVAARALHPVAALRVLVEYCTSKWGKGGV